MAPFDVIVSRPPTRYAAPKSASFTTPSPGTCSITSQNVPVSGSSTVSCSVTTCRWLNAARARASARNRLEPGLSASRRLTTTSRLRPRSRASQTSVAPPPRQVTSR
ncbi:hypothetical protein ACIBI9_17370 [Nonomuraea sp. NPDC050451]|uniref:hypothetical protein n=1 Tax=Nonomuraea sp. NPDC050451 TaxID=3364364 RepID=UPI003787E100